MVTIRSAFFSDTFIGAQEVEGGGSCAQISPAQARVVINVLFQSDLAIR
jgi:hypothetical protein